MPNRDVIQASRFRDRRTFAVALPGVESEGMVVIAGGEEGSPVWSAPQLSSDNVAIVSDSPL
jgi:hypothetical protein